jgi:hypothetical protein
MKLFCCSLLIFEKANNRGKLGRAEEVWYWNFAALFGNGEVKEQVSQGANVQTQTGNQQKPKQKRDDDPHAITTSLVSFCAL